jgi:hypothetical protein
VGLFLIEVAAAVAVEGVGNAVDVWGGVFHTFHSEDASRLASGKMGFV